MDFSEQAKAFAPFGDAKQSGVNMAKDVPSIFGIIRKFDPVINEIHIFKKGEDGSQLEAIEEANILQQKIRDIKFLYKNEEY